MRITSTHTVVLLELPPEMWKHIRDKMLEAGYGDRIMDDGVSVDMQGIAVTPEKQDELQRGG